MYRLFAATTLALSLTLSASEAMSQSVHSVIVSVLDLRPSPRTSFGAEMFYVLHDGSYDIYNQGEVASEALRRFANEGDRVAILTAFYAASPGARGDRLFLAEQSLWGSSASYWEIPPYFLPSASRYLSFGMKLCPSDDAFIANEDPKQIEVFDANGQFLGPQRFYVYPSQIMDAGTRQNNETDLGCLDRPLMPGLQEVVDGGVRTHEPIRPHPGFNGSVGNPDATPVNILGRTGTYSSIDSGLPIPYQYDQIAADFTAGEAPIAEITIMSGLHGGYSGVYYDPQRAGEGMTIDIGGQWPNRKLSLTWYTYRADGSGDPTFLVGTADIGSSGTADVDLYEFSGGRFGSTDNPSTVVESQWGSMRVRFNGNRCDGIVVLNVAPLDASITPPPSFEAIRLTPIPTGFEPFCHHSVFPSARLAP